MPEKTIIALASAPGIAGISVLRVSGSICSQILQKELGCLDLTSHVMHHGKFTDPIKGEPLDELNFVYMQGPSTYTGEDVLEIYPHGNPFLIQNLMDVLLRRKEVRWAKPGEFTQRSFENGKRDLMQSEAVHQFIHAGNNLALQNSRKIMMGQHQKPLKELKEKLKRISIELELDVDFSEEELEPAYDTWKLKLEKIHHLVQELCDSWERGKRIQTDPKIAIFGSPNAGKSSLINAILKIDRMLVSDIPGTTRDYVDVPINLKNGKVHLIDTAGIADQSVSELDSRAMKYTHEILSQVDYKILLLDGTSNLADKPQTGNPDLTLMNKSDLPQFKNPTEHPSISAKTGEGIDAFLEELDNHFFKNTLASEEIFIATERQYSCLKTALLNLTNALTNLDENPEVEILAFEIRDCHKQLAELIGEYNNEETLTSIFSGFCIGK